MSATLSKIQRLVESGDTLVTDHAFTSLSDDGLAVVDITRLMDQAVVVEDYEDYHKGPAVLLLTYDGKFGAVHSLWGIPAGKTRPATLITAYLPDEKRWEPNMKTRKPR